MRSVTDLQLVSYVNVYWPQLSQLSCLGFRSDPAQPDNIANVTSILQITIQAVICIPCQDSDSPQARCSNFISSCTKGAQIHQPTCLDWPALLVCSLLASHCTLSSLNMFDLLCLVASETHSSVWAAYLYLVNKYICTSTSYRKRGIGKSKSRTRSLSEGRFSKEFRGLHLYI